MMELIGKLFKVGHTTEDGQVVVRIQELESRDPETDAGLRGKRVKVTVEPID